jgi:molecular chaperone DnaJ
LKIGGEGVKRRGNPGDLLVRVKIVTPRSLSNEQKELYAKLAELEGKSTGAGGFFSGIMGKKKGKK